MTVSTNSRTAKKRRLPSPAQLVEEAFEAAASPGPVRSNYAFHCVLERAKPALNGQRLREAIVDGGPVVDLVMWLLSDRPFQMAERAQLAALLAGRMHSLGRPLKVDLPAAQGYRGLLEDPPATYADCSRCKRRLADFSIARTVKGEPKASDTRP